MKTALLIVLVALTVGCAVLLATVKTAQEPGPTPNGNVNPDGTQDYDQYGPALKDTFPHSRS